MIRHAFGIVALFGTPLACHEGGYTLRGSIYVRPHQQIWSRSSVRYR